MVLLSIDKPDKNLARLMRPFQAGERKLAVMRKQSTPVELLMESIRSEKSRNSLRKTSGPPTRERLGEWWSISDMLTSSQITMAISSSRQMYLLGSHNQIDREY